MGPDPPAPSPSGSPSSPVSDRRVQRTRICAAGSASPHRLRPSHPTIRSRCRRTRVAQRNHHLRRLRCHPAIPRGSLPAAATPVRQTVHFTTRTPPRGAYLMRTPSRRPRRRWLHRRTDRHPAPHRSTHRRNPPRPDLPQTWDHLQTAARAPRRRVRIHTRSVVSTDSGNTDAPIPDRTWSP